MMDQKELQDLSEKIVQAVFLENGDQIVKGLAQGLSWDDGWERTITQAAYNATVVATTRSVQIVLDLLLKTGLFTISEEVTRPHLTVLPGGRHQEGPDK